MSKIVGSWVLLLVAFVATAFACEYCFGTGKCPLCGDRLHGLAMTDPGANLQHEQWRCHRCKVNFDAEAVRNLP